MQSGERRNICLSREWRQVVGVQVVRAARACWQVKRQQWCKRKDRLTVSAGHVQSDIQARSGV